MYRYVGAVLPYGSYIMARYTTAMCERGNWVMVTFLGMGIGEVGCINPAENVVLHLQVKYV